MDDKERQTQTEADEHWLTVVGERENSQLHVSEGGGGKEEERRRRRRTFSILSSSMWSLREIRSAARRAASFSALAPDWCD